MANIYSLQLLRNGQVFTSKEQALTQLTSGAAQDGVIKLARYTQAGTDPYSGDTNGGVKTIFAFRHEVGGQSGWTVYEDYKEVLDIIKAKIDSLSGDGSGSIYDQIMQEINKLDYSGVTTGDGVVVTNVTETDGKVSATAAEVGGLKLTNYALGTNSGAVAANDTINEALSKLQNQVNKANEDAEEAIKALDANITAENGFIIDHIEQVDGKISGTTKALPSLDEVHVDGKPIIAVSEDKGQLAASAGTINAEFVNVADANSAFTATTVEDVLAEIDAAYKAADAAIVGGASDSANTLGKLEDIVNDLNADAATYTIRKDDTGLPAGVKERYTLVETKNGTSTDKTVAIDIPKDSHIVSIEYISDSGDTHYQNLKYTYMDVNGAEQTVYVDMANLVFESEFKSGVTATDGIVHGVVDPTSESFLTVGENGFKLTGVSGLVDNQIAALDATGGTQTIAAGKHVAVEVIETDGKITAVNVAEDNIASKSDLDALSAKTVTGVEMTGGTAAIDNNTDGTKKITIDTDGSKILATGYAKGTDKSAIVATDSINAALAKLENQVDAAKAAATTKVVEGTDAGNNLEIVPTTSTTDGSVTYTINLTDVASDSALTAEIAARKAVDGQNGQTYAANANTNYISGASNLNDADVKLDAAIKALEGAAQTEIDAIEAAVGLGTDGTHQTSTGKYTSTATTIEGEIVALDGQVKANADAIDALEDAFVSGATMNGTGVTKANNALAFTAVGKQTAATATGNEAIVVETDANGGLTLGIASLDAGTY